MSGTHSRYSPSSLKRLDACPGCIHVCAGLPEPPAGEAAESGTRIHQAVAFWFDAAGCGGEPASPDQFGPVQALPTDEERELACDCIAFGGMLMDTVHSDPGSLGVESELRVSCSNGPDELYYGTADLVLTTPEGDTVIVDWKTGGAKVDAAEENLQGAAYALCLLQRHPGRTCTVIFYNPRIHQDTRAVFSDALALQARIVGIIDATRAADAPVRSGSHCRYCPAYQLGTCPVIAGQVAALAAEGPREEKSWGEMDEAELASRYALLRTVEAQCALAEAEVRRRIQASPSGQACGWTEKGVSGGFEAKDPAALYASVSQALTSGEFLACCKVSVPQVEAAVGKAFKANGDAKSLAEGKRMAHDAMLEFLAPKPARKVLAPAKEEEK